MAASGSMPLEHDDQGRALECLLDAFSAVFSLEEIASAYCKVGQNADLAGAMLYDLQNFKASKTRIYPASMGTVSSVLGKSYARPMTSPNGTCVTTKPLKLDPEDLPISKVWEKECLTNSAKDDGTQMDIEDFLLKLLGDGFKLDRDMIREVLGCCGYDVEKTLEKGLKMESLSCAASNGNKILQTNEIKLPEEQKGKNDILKELLTSLFNVPERPEEFSGIRIGVNDVNRASPFGQVVVEPLRDTAAEHKTGMMNPHHKNEDDEEDSYKVLRMAVKEYRGTMKEYYKAAVEAFAAGDHVRAGKLLEEGHFFHRKAREADEESVQKIFEARKEETREALSLDVHNLGAKEAIRLLKCHLSSLSGIPSMKFLKVIIERNEQDISKGARKRLIIRFLEKESIKWIEEGNAGTILICLDEINPKHLSFAKK